jgi:predicted nucleic acid-binding protein
LFLDTSSLVKLYVEEAGRDEVVALCRSATTLAVSALAEFEFLSAIGRRRADGELTAKGYEQTRAAFYADWSEIFVHQPLSDAVMTEVRTLLSAYRLRTLDAFQLASAITYSNVHGNKPVFVTADAALRDIAEREGFETIA